MHRIMPTVVLALLAGTALLAAACNSTNGSLPEGPGKAQDAPPPEDIVSGVGTVRHVQLEGGFYGLVADDSTRYNPQHLDEPYRQDGLRVRFRAVKKNDVMTTQMWGQPVEILQMMRLNEQ